MTNNESKADKFRQLYNNSEARFDVGFMTRMRAFTPEDTLVLGATNFMEQGRRAALNTANYLASLNYADLEKRILAAYSADDAVVIIDSIYRGVNKVETIADQKSWEPKLTCGSCGFRAATTDMFFGHTDRAHPPHVTNHA